MTNYKHQYEQMKLMVDKYQNEIVPGLRKLIAEREPVRHGRWVFEEDEVHPWLTKAICSNCEKVAEKSSHLQFRIGKKTFLHDHTYCPNCGAKMDGDSHADV